MAWLGQLTATAAFLNGAEPIEGRKSSSALLWAVPGWATAVTLSARLFHWICRLRLGARCTPLRETRQLQPLLDSL